MSQSHDAIRMLGNDTSETLYIPMYTQMNKPRRQTLYVLKCQSKVETRYVSHIGTRRNYTTELEFALTFASRSEAQSAAASNERVCLLSEESLYQ